MEKVGIYGSAGYALIELCQIPNVMSKSLCDRLALTPEESKRRITTVTGVKSPVHGILKDVPIFFDHLVHPIHFPVIEGSPYEMIIGRRKMRKLNRVIDYGK